MEVLCEIPVLARQLLPLVLFESSFYSRACIYRVYNYKVSVVKWFKTLHEFFYRPKRDFLKSSQTDLSKIKETKKQTQDESKLKRAKCLFFQPIGKLFPKISWLLAGTIKIAAKSLINEQQVYVNVMSVYNQSITCFSQYL